MSRPQYVNCSMSLGDDRYPLMKFKTLVKVIMLCHTFCKRGMVITFNYHGQVFFYLHGLLRNKGFLYEESGCLAKYENSSEGLHNRTAYMSLEWCAGTLSLYICIYIFIYAIYFIIHLQLQQLLAALTVLSYTKAFNDACGMWGDKNTSLQKSI